MRRSIVSSLGLVLVLAPLPSRALPAVPIPEQPGQGAAPVFEGAAVEADPAETFDPPRHPFMAPNGRSNMHNDAYMTDAYAWEGPLGHDTGVISTWLGLEECASLTFDSRDRIVTLCGTADGARLRLVDPTSLETLAILPLPPRSVRPGTTPLTDICAAGYFYLDDRDRAIVSTNTNQIWVVEIDQTPAFRVVETHDLLVHVPPPDCIVSVLPDWEGWLWFVTSRGTVGVIGPHSISSTAFTEPIFNSFAVDGTGGVFVVTDRALYRFDYDPGTYGPSITWREPYDRGTRVKPGQLSQGSGTSPTLVGEDLVAITDNAEPRMNVLLYRRAADVDGERLVCAEPVFADGASATENSVIAVGDSLVVENNYGYTGPPSTAGGASTSPGVARVDVDRDAGTCATAWISAEVVPTTVPKASVAAGLVYVYAKPPSASGVDAWYLTAIDIDTGETAWRRLTGRGYLYNNHYAPVSIGPDGAAYVGALGGLIRIADGSAS